VADFLELLVLQEEKETKMLISALNVVKEVTGQEIVIEEEAAEEEVVLEAEIEIEEEEEVDLDPEVDQEVQEEIKEDQEAKADQEAQRNQEEVQVNHQREVQVRNVVHLKVQRRKTILLKRKDHNPHETVKMMINQFKDFLVFILKCMESIEI